MRAPGEERAQLRYEFVKARDDRNKIEDHVDYFWNQINATLGLTPSERLHWPVLPKDLRSVRRNKNELERCELVCGSRGAELNSHIDIEEIADVDLELTDAWTSRLPYFDNRGILAGFQPPPNVDELRSLATRPVPRWACTYEQEIRGALRRYSTAEYFKLLQCMDFNRARGQGIARMPPRLYETTYIEDLIAHLRRLPFANLKFSIPPTLNQFLLDSARHGVLLRDIVLVAYGKYSSSAGCIILDEGALAEDFNRIETTIRSAKVRYRKRGQPSPFPGRETTSTSLDVPVRFAEMCRASKSFIRAGAIIEHVAVRYRSIAGHYLGTPTWKNPNEHQESRVLAAATPEEVSQLVGHHLGGEDNTQYPARPNL